MLGIVKALAECRVMVIVSPYPVIVYTDHQNLISTLSAKGYPVRKVTR